MRRALLARALALLALGTLLACGEPVPVRVGAKGFTEQRVLAQALRLLLEESGRPARVVDCKDPFGCQQALRGGRIDVLVEYAGTAALYAGLPATAARAEVAEAYQAQGIEVLRPLGFDNGYVVVVAEGRAAEARLSTIGDLASLGEITVAVPPTYARRPRDGLPALSDRYGLRTHALRLDTPRERIDAVIDERADVAVVFATDGVIEGAPVRILEDEERFFPDYSAQVFARTAALDEATAALAKLSITNEEMRRANFAVDVEGHSPRDAALRLLVERELLKPRASRGSALKIVAPAAVHWPQAESAARRATRAAFPGRPVSYVRSGEPLEVLAHGKARLALVPASEFYRKDRRGEWRRADRAEALVVVGRELLHLVSKGGETGSIGITPASRVEQAVLEALDRRPAAVASAEKLLEDVKDGRLDAALILAEPGDPLIAGALGGGLRLTPLPREAFKKPVPFVRPARLPPRTYAGAAPVQTWAVQIVLAGPTTRSERVGGPAGALTSSAPLNEQELRALERADGVLERPDPALPVPWTRHVPTAVLETRGSKLLNTLLSAFALFFLGWTAALALGRR